MNIESLSTNSSQPGPIRELLDSWGVSDEDGIGAISEADRALIQRVVDNETELDATLDDLADGILQRYSKEYRENLAIVRRRGSSRSPEADEATKRQRALFAQVREAIIADADIDGVDVNSDYNARLGVENRLKAAQIRDGANFSPLRELGMIQQNSDGEDVFVFPADIMPSSTVEKWSAYMLSVSAHLRAERDLYSGRGTQEDLMRADSARANAHNLITNDLKGLLGVDDFEEMRRTVAKMRDGSFPNISTGEESRVNEKIKSGLSDAAARGVMRDRLLGDGIFYDPSDSSTHSEY